MSNDIKLQRLAQLVDIYGDDPDNWPDGARNEELRQLMASEEARRYLHEAEGLDKLIGNSSEQYHAIDINIETLAERIMTNLPEQTHEVTAPNGPSWKNSALIMPALAASILLTVVLFLVPHAPRENLVAADIEIIEQFLWSELGETPTDTDNELDFIDMIELEIDAV